MKIFFVILCLFLLTSCSTVEQTETPLEEPFCGTSTQASCTSNTECITGGCSGQICQSSSEEQGISTCEYRDCYNEEDYALSCSCTDNVCQWA